MKKRSTEELKQAVAEDAKDQYFCPLPFEHVYSDNAGLWGLCCRSYPFDYAVGNTTPEEHWGNPLMEEIRREMLSGELKLVRKYCWKCLKLEKEGLKSARQQLNASLLKKAEKFGRSRTLEAAATMTRHPESRYVPGERTLELKLRVFGNYCQLACYMCSPVNSTTRYNEMESIRDGYWLKQMKAPVNEDFFESDADYERFIDSAINLLPYVKKIKITGGEPFVLQRHYQFLEKVVATEHASKIRLAYDTNLMKFQLGNANVLDYMRKFKAVTLAVSVDDLGGKNDFIRWGAKFDRVIKNIGIAQEVPGINVVVSCATSILNAGDVHEIAEFFHGIGIEAKFNMCVVNWPVFLQARHLPDELKEKVLQKLEGSPYREQFANVIRMVRQPRDEEEFQTFLEYVADLDQHRGTSYLELWPEFAPYHRNRRTPRRSGAGPAPAACFPETSS